MIREIAEWCFEACALALFVGMILLWAVIYIGVVQL